MEWDIVLVSSHLGARVTGGKDYTDHAWWQGKFYSRSGKDKRFLPYSVCGEGDVQGIHGANCRHSHGPGDGEFNPYEQYDSEENRKEYELQQRQRTMERRIRASKRECLGLKEAADKAGTPEGKAMIEAEYQKKAALLQKRNEAYNQFCEENDLKKLNERITIAKWDRKQAAQARAAAKRREKELANSKNDGKIEMNRRNKNPGAFSVLPERMSKKHIRKIAEEFGISLKGIKLNIEYNEDMIGMIYTGRADPEQIGGMTFFPSAFRSKENLVRTLFHEKEHVKQFKEFGVEYVQKNRAHFERLAYEAENEFVKKLKEQGAF